MKVLHVDPDQYYHQKLQQSVATDLELITGEKGGELFPLLNDCEPDAVVMELFYPDVHGYDLLRQLKVHPKHSQIPVIIFSKISNLEDILEAMNFGVVGFFVKGQNTTQEVHRLLLTLA